MRASSPLDALSRALAHAAYVALPDVSYTQRNYQAMAKWSAEQRAQARQAEDYPQTLAHRRPDASEIRVVAMFPQTWGSTALGFGGLGGAAMTEAYTTVLEGPGRQQAVYWAGQFAYLIDLARVSDAQRETLLADLAGRRTVSLEIARERYGATTKDDRAAS